MKTLGVIGGLGPIATAYFFELIIKMTDVDCDQGHLDMIIYNHPSTPDRTSYILDKNKANPLPDMIDMGNKLVAQGAEFIAIPCITAHYFHSELETRINAPIIHLIKETVAHLKQNGVHKVGIMATDGTIYSKLFQNELEANSMIPVVPEPEYQQMVMELIYKNVKANIKPDMDKFKQVSKHLRKNGAEVIILGCTELSLIKREENIGSGYIDAMEVLAMCSITIGNVPLKEEYRCLITK